jgi:membrane-associated phospholipid phosphatase
MLNMSDQSAPALNKFPLGLCLLILLFPLIMIPLGLVDYEWTVWVYQNRNDLFGELMKRTYLEGGAPGCSDPAILFLIIMIILYFCYPKSKQNPTSYLRRPFLGFVFFSTVVTGLCLVQSLKFALGRARPNLVLKHDLAFTNWHDFGVHFISDGVFYGSFPSGHTATVFLLITISYLLIGDPFGSVKQKTIGWIWGLLVFTFSLLMSLGRSMTLDHWLTDCVGIILMAWILIHLIYFYVLNIPGQMRYAKLHGSYAPPAKYWELSLLWRLLVITVGVLSIIIGIRSVVLQKVPLLILIAIPGTYVVYHFTKSLRLVHREFMMSFSD